MGMMVVKGCGRGRYCGEVFGGPRCGMGGYKYRGELREVLFVCFGGGNVRGI